MPDSHLDDEQLSALLDRVDRADDGATLDALDEHVGSCATCRDRLGRLESAVAAVAAPVPPLPPELLDRMVGRAIDAAGPARIVSFEQIAQRRRRRIPSAAALGAVAAVLVFLLAIPALLSGLGSGGGDDSDSQASLAAGKSEEQDTRTQAATDAGASQLTNEAATGMAAPAASGFATRSASLGEFETEDDLVRSLVAELSTGAGTAADEAESAASTTPEIASVCEPAAREVGGSRLGGRTFVGQITWRSEAAEVHVFELTEPVEGNTRQAYVMARQGCRVLAEPRF